MTGLILLKGTIVAFSEANATKISLAMSARIVLRHPNVLKIP